MTRNLYFNEPSPDSVLITGSEMLKKAERQLNSGGWHQGDFHDAVGGGSCALGAVEKANTGYRLATQDYIGSMDALLNCLKEIYPTLEAETIPEINDDPQVTYEGMLLAFKNAITAVEEKEKVGG